jgi:hypothetical protein
MNSNPEFDSPGQARSPADSDRESNDDLVDLGGQISGKRSSETLSGMMSVVSSGIW